MKLVELAISNFGCFGKDAQIVAIDDIVVLIGQNNTGKSTILDAYEAFASQEKLSAAYFHCQSTCEPVQITGKFAELTEDDIKIIKKKNVFSDPEHGDCILYRIQWDAPDQKGNKYSYDSETDSFIKGGLGGWDTLVSSRIPVPLRIRPEDSPEKTEKQIVDLLVSATKDGLKQDSTKLQTAIESLNTMAKEYAESIQEELNSSFSNISSKISTIFPSTKINLLTEITTIGAEKLIADNTCLLVEDIKGNCLPLNRQGSGLQRAYLWSAISGLAELGKYKSGKNYIEPSKPRILLIDEPESFLHPPAIRSAREALYSLAETENWQVIATTHSPIFIDVSKPHTTIIRIDNNNSGSSKILSTDKLEFDENDRKNLQMIRNCHPTVNEFFFSSKVILVEGDTEHTILSSQNPTESDVCIVNCLGKANIPTFAEIMNHFRVPYIALHDTDSPHVQSKSGIRKSSMWTINISILNKTYESNGLGKVAAQIPTFEPFYLGESYSADKPYKAHSILMSKDPDDAPLRDTLSQILSSLIEGTHKGFYADQKSLLSLYEEWLKNSEKKDDPLWQLQN